MYETLSVKFMFEKDDFGRQLEIVKRARVTYASCMLITAMTISDEGKRLVAVMSVINFLKGSKVQQLSLADVHEVLRKKVEPLISFA